MSLRLLAVAALLAAGLSGCIDSPVTPDAVTPPVSQVAAVAGPLYKGLGALFAGPALYLDPQNSAHPAYNWPTLAQPSRSSGTPAFWAPIDPTTIPATIADLQHLVKTPGVTKGAGIALFGSIAIVPGYGAPSYTVDISTPTAPKILGNFTSQLGSHRGATVIAYPTGRLVTVISTGSGLDVWDISDPSKPSPLPPIEVPSHKVGVVPGTPFVYNARSDGGGSFPAAGPGNVDPALGTGIMDIYDFSDPENVITLEPFHNGYGCHHVYFWNSVEKNKYRGLCAGIEYTQIFDTADPAKPKLIVSVPYGHGVNGLPSGSASLASFSHYAGLSTDGTILLVGDESGGGLGPIGCTAAADTPAGRVGPPVGAVWFYDISTETDPQLVGWVSASQLEKAGVSGAAASCTAHHGRLIPVPGRDVLAMSFYGAGVVVVDFTALREGPGLTKVVAQYADNSNTWETWYYQGYLFTGDLNRGMDVLKMI
ncbi:MAG TPA: hypothetical protein VM286_03090 [Candidatus Thermoplasmatota archaeon]|nr:hypothetical protein [Candidatus Thermoplasmatota archaeon]